MAFCHYFYHAKDFTDDLLSHILSYCDYNDVNFVVTILQQQPQPPPLPQRTCPDESHPQYDNETVQAPHLLLRWQNLYVWYELFQRDGYAFDNDHDIPMTTTTSLKNSSIGNTNYWKLYEYRKKLQQNLYGISSTSNAAAANINVDGMNDNDSDCSNSRNIAVTKQSPFIYSSLIRTTTSSPKTILVNDLLLSSSRAIQNSLGWFNSHILNRHHHDQHHYPPGNICFNRRCNGDGLVNFNFQLISNATGTSLLTIDQSEWIPDTNHNIKNVDVPRFGDQQKTESLNVASATAIFLSEFKRGF